MIANLASSSRTDICPELVECGTERDVLDVADVRPGTHFLRRTHSPPCSGDLIAA
jgi:hypothetical protein